MIQVDSIISKSVFASVVVSLGAALFLLSGDYILFTLLLTSLIIYNGNLFTLKAGFISESIDFRRISLILIINLLVVFIAGILIGISNATIIDKANTLLTTHLNESYLSLIIKSIVAGFMMTYAVESSVRHPNHYVLPVLCMFGIIFTDCQHCVTEMFYYGASNILFDHLGTLLLRMLLIVLFNFLGCNVFNLVVSKSFIYKQI